jgi:hypothetical protein
MILYHWSAEANLLSLEPFACDDAALWALTAGHASMSPREKKPDDI